MNKYFKQIKNLKLDSLAIILLTIFAISILGFQMSKTSAQTFSSLSNDLNVARYTDIRNNLIVNGRVGVGAPTTQFKLDVTGDGRFTEVVYANTPGDSQTYALATVAYLKSKIEQYVGPLPANW